MILNETFPLADGTSIPKIGFGTWLINGAAATQAVMDAIAAGYRHIDTAWAYGNEKEVGEGIRRSGVPREELYVTTKLHADFKTYEAAKQGIEESLARLDVGYVDLMLIHAPQPWNKFREGDHYQEGNLAAWKALEEAQQAGKIRSIGVANFEPEDLENILKHCTVKPVVNQVLCHISNTPQKVIEYSQKHGILVEAYSPIGHGAVLKNPELQAMAKKYGVSVAQLCIRYCLQLGTLPLPKTANPAHMKNNADVDGFVITDADMETLKTMPTIQNYGEGAGFPVFGGKINDDGTLTSRDFVKRD